MGGEDYGRLVYLMLLLAALGGWVMVEYRGRMGFALRTAMAWGLIFTGIAAGYALWQDIRGGELGLQSIAEDGRIELPRASDGHYYVTLDVGADPVRFMIDTGASGVVLRKEDARSLGIDPDTLAYRDQAYTANGVVRTARVFLDDVRLGPHRDDRIEAWVNDGDLDISLLGMEYLGRYRIEIDGGEMVLTR